MSPVYLFEFFYEGMLKIHKTDLILLRRHVEIFTRQTEFFYEDMLKIHNTDVKTRAVSHKLIAGHTH